ncbi:hypothetical protein SISSUDRAFT_76885 [Sistotremastrum suecicum HHB10207 ss-3]|uniref:Uncharacterized protein n=1 Tax=Sistotremastrum suecicum HHB10207 ss-3 TaxID=1314776 RepID=A0A166H2D2_9AGAM|nr:hypothetical protein SISSUDRAFT_76885 [Sistotremastrum suecicum HHB10207 ss-3]
MSSTTTTTSSSLAAMAAKFKIRKGAPLPLLLDSFPVPPNHLPSPIGRPPTSPLPPLPPSSSRPTPATVITASSPPSSPPAKSKSRKSKSRMDATLSTIDTRAESPDIKDLLPPKSSRKNDYDWGRSLAKMDGSWDVEDVLRDEGTQDLEYNSDSSIDLHTPLPYVFISFLLSILGFGLMGMQAHHVTRGSALTALQGTSTSPVLTL